MTTEIKVQNQLIKLDLNWSNSSKDINYPKLKSQFCNEPPESGVTESMISQKLLKYRRNFWAFLSTTACNRCFSRNIGQN